MKSTQELWYLDSGCSKHMTGDANKFLVMTRTKHGNVTFGGDNKGTILGVGSVGKDLSSSIDDVLLVKNLQHNLLSVSQLCDKGNRVIFESRTCLVQQLCDDKIIMRGRRIDNIYMVDLDCVTSSNAKCFIGKEEQSWL